MDERRKGAHGQAKPIEKGERGRKKGRGIEVEEEANETREAKAMGSKKEGKGQREGGKNE